MIKVTKLNDDNVYINTNLIEFIEETPDTVITLTTNKKVIVKESAERVIELIIHYNHKLSREV